jgi:MSHA biogenesis protein MshK
VFKSLLIIVCLAACTVQAQTPDPTKPLNAVASAGAAASGGKEKIILTSILISRDRKLAIINGQTLQENQLLKGFGARIKTIDADAVTLQQNGKVWRVPLNSAIIRQ